MNPLLIEYQNKLSSVTKRRPRNIDFQLFGEDMALLCVACVPRYMTRYISQIGSFTNTIIGWMMQCPNSGTKISLCDRGLKLRSGFYYMYQRYLVMSVHEPANATWWCQYMYVPVLPGNVKLPSKVLHQIYIDFYVHFMHDFWR